MKTLTKEYDQVPLKVGDVGKVYPHFVELQDLLTLTKESDMWVKFLKTGEQDLDGFVGDDSDEVFYPALLSIYLRTPPYCVLLLPPTPPAPSDLVA